MGKETGISWTQHSFNPWWGCTKVSPGCDHCYAETFDKRVGGNHWGKGVPRRVFGDKHWAEPLAWDKAAGLAGVKEKVFCASMADVMDDEAPEDQRERLWELIDKTSNLTWQLLTKRPHRYIRFLPAEFKYNNVWLGTSAENQPLYDARWLVLANVAKAFGLISFVSYEPAIGALRMGDAPCAYAEGYPDWIICGGESGNDRRPMEIKWAEDLKKECDEHNVKFFMKQVSARTPNEGAKLIPAHLLVREFPA